MFAKKGRCGDGGAVDERCRVMLGGCQSLAGGGAEADVLKRLKLDVLTREDAVEIMRGF